MNQQEAHTLKENWHWVPGKGSSWVSVVMPRGQGGSQGSKWNLEVQTSDSRDLFSPLFTYTEM